MKTESRLAAERIMKTPEYWPDPDLDLHEQGHCMMQAEVGTGSGVGSGYV
jgi:hypothetical protein